MLPSSQQQPQQQQRQQLPVIDLAATNESIAEAIGDACRSLGFFYVRNHGVDRELIERLRSLSLEFFSWPESSKERFSMQHGGRAWRGYFPLGGELTSGVPDQKTGLYLGVDLPADDARVVAQQPLHGANLLPSDAELPRLRASVNEYIGNVSALADRLLEHVAASLGLARDYFRHRYTHDPLVLFRIFLYPSIDAPPAASWGVGEHTDYGLLTLLWQDDVGGLQVRSAAAIAAAAATASSSNSATARTATAANAWLDVPPIDGTFVVNIGDMLDRMTAGLYRSTPHRVRVNTSGRSRLSMPLFFDPSMHAVIEPIRTPSTDEARADANSRWDHTSVHTFAGTYADYVLAKIGRVFPQLATTTNLASSDNVVKYS